MPPPINPSSPLHNPNLPYSGDLPSASLSGSSLRLHSERSFLFNRNRSKSVVQPDSPGALSDSSEGPRGGGASYANGNHARGGLGSGPAGFSSIPGGMRDGSTDATMQRGGVQGWSPPNGFGSMPTPTTVVGMYGSRPAMLHRDTAPTTPSRPMGGSYSNNHAYASQGYTQDPYLPAARAGPYAQTPGPYAISNLQSSTSSLASTEDGMSLPPLPPPPPLPINAHSYSSSHPYTHSHSSSSGSITSAGIGAMSSAAGSPRIKPSTVVPVGGGSQRTLQSMARAGHGGVYQSGSSSAFSSSNQSLAQAGAGPFRGHAMQDSTGSASGSSSGKGKGRQLSGDGHNLPALPTDSGPDETPPASAFPTPTPEGVSAFPARKVHHSKGSSGQIPEDTFEHDTDENQDSVMKWMHASTNARYIIAELKRSRDEGDTIDLSKKAIEKVDSGDVALLARVGRGKRGVWRMALSYNRLTGLSLDSSFTQLSRLRYLNLKGNHLTHVPAPLLNMPGLQILDLSKNQIASLPEEPGRLVQLSVLSLTANRITRLPGYLVYFANLRVLKLEQNPLEWPPPEVLKVHVDGQSGIASDDRRHKSQGSGGDMLNQGSGQRKEGEEDMRVWIATIKDWMRDHEHEQVRLLSESMNRGDTNEAEDQLEGTQSPRSPGLDRLPPFKMPLTSSPVQTPVAFSASGSPNGGPTGSIKARRRAYTTAGERVPELDLSSISDPSVSSLDTSAPSSASSSAAYSDLQPSALVRGPSASSTIRDGRYGAQHNKSSSLTADHRMSSSSLASKKSLPDLRQDHAKIISDRRSTESTSSSSRDSFNPGLGIDIPSRRMTPPGIGTKSLSAKGSMTNLHAVMEEEGTRPSHAAELNGAGLVTLPWDDKLESQPTQQNRDTSAQILRHGPPKASEDAKDAYFRRSSTLPNLERAVIAPTGITRFVEAVKGLLFAFSQLNSALRQYTRYGMTDKIAAIFQRAMDPMSGVISTIIRSLERCEAVSSGKRPDAHIVRQLVEAALRGIKAVSGVSTVLQQQTTALAGVAEHRYTRSFLLAVYGSLGEISASWKIMSSTLPDVGQAIASNASQQVSLAGHRRQISRVSADSLLATSPPRHRAGKHSISSVDSLGLKTSPSVRQVVSNRERAKRNAGSFSAEDVQTGMMLGPESTHGSEEYIPLSRKPSISLEEVQEEDEERLRDSTGATPVAIRVDPNNAPEAMFSPHKTPLPAKHAATGSATSSLGSLTALRMGLREAAGDVIVQDKLNPADPLMESLEEATALANTVWPSLIEELGDSPSSGTLSNRFAALKPLRLPDKSPKHVAHAPGQRSKHMQDLHAELGRAEEITSSLRALLKGHRADVHGRPAEDDAGLVLEAEGFVTAVHQISDLLSAVSRDKSLSPTAKSSLSKLKAKARECEQVMPVSGLPRFTDAFGPRSASASAGLMTVQGKHADGSPGGFAIGAATKSSLPAAMSGGVAALRQAMPARSRSANILPHHNPIGQGRRAG